MRITGLALMAALAPMLLVADTMTLRDGTTYSGAFISGSTRSITFRDDAGVGHRVPINQVQSLNFIPQGVGAAYRSQGYMRTVPAGTTVTVQSQATIDSNSAYIGQTFPAVISEDVRDSSGPVVIPQGSPATLVIRSFAGTNGAAPTLAADLQSVDVNGVRYYVSSSNATSAQTQANATVLGTLLSSILGGSQNTTVATAGNSVWVPAHTTLTFQLNSPMLLQQQ